MSIIIFLLFIFTTFSVICLFVLPIIAPKPLPLRDILIATSIILLLLTLAGGLSYAKAQGKLDVIESYCGKTVSPLSLIFYPEIEDKVILECEQRTVTPSSEVVQ